MAAISPRKKVEWTGNALRPYLFCSALSCRRSSSQPTLIGRSEIPSRGSAWADSAAACEVRWVSSMPAGLLGTDRAVEQTVSDHGPVRAVGYGKAWQRAVGRTTADRGVIGRIVDAAVARTQDQAISVQLLEDRATEVGADGAVGDQSSRPITRCDAHDLEQVVLVVGLAHREQLGRSSYCQVGSFEWLAGLAAARRIGIGQHIADGDDRLFEHQRLKRRGRHRETYGERARGYAHHPAEQSATACTVRLGWIPRRGWRVRGPTRGCRLVDVQGVLHGQQRPPYRGAIRVRGRDNPHQLPYRRRLLAAQRQWPVR